MPDPDSNASPISATVLAIDASGGRCSVAALLPDGSIVSQSESLQRGHAERVFPLVEKTLRRAAVTVADFDVIAAARGPGSFTGVRVGVAAARGLALAVGKTAVGVDGFAAIAAAAEAQGVSAQKAAIVFGKPPRLFGQCWRVGKAGAEALGDPMTFDPVQGMFALDTQVVMGPGAELAKETLSAAGWGGEVDTRFSEIDVAWIARLAALCGSPSGGAGEVASPLYLRPPDAEPSQERRPSRLGPQALR